jgi:hypothetical protein
MTDKDLFLIVFIFTPANSVPYVKNVVGYSHWTYSLRQTVRVHLTPASCRCEIPSPVPEVATIRFSFPSRVTYGS